MQSARSEYKYIVVESLAYCQEQKGLDIYSWVLMTNHLHMIVGTNKADVSLSDILRDFKKYTNKKILAAIEGNQQEFAPLGFAASLCEELLTQLAKVE